MRVERRTFPIPWRAFFLLWRRSLLRLRFRFLWGGFCWFGTKHTRPLQTSAMLQCDLEIILTIVAWIILVAPAKSVSAATPRHRRLHGNRSLWEGSAKPPRVPSTCFAAGARWQRRRVEEYRMFLASRVLRGFLSRTDQAYAISRLKPGISYFLPRICRLSVYCYF